MNQKLKELIAWSVHAYTITGGILGLFALIAIVDGRMITAWVLLGIAICIDMTDGMAARKFRVREVLPFFDGAKVDDLVDFLTYVWIPVLILYVENLVTNPVWLVLPVLGSLYAYGQPGMKEIDGEAYFVGFPSYWNVLALYLYWLQPTETMVVGILVFFTILSFIPSRYIYPTKNPRFPIPTLGLGVIWLFMIAFLLGQENPNRLLIQLSMVYPIYYLCASFFIELNYHRETFIDRIRSRASG